MRLLWFKTKKRMVVDKDNTMESGGYDPISRKEALVKTGKYAVFTASAMMSILDPLNAQQPPKSPPKPPRPRSGGKSAKKPNKTTPPTY